MSYLGLLYTALFLLGAVSYLGHAFYSPDGSSALLIRRRELTQN